MRRLLLALALLPALIGPALAQGNTTGLVVSSCNTQTYHAGNPGPFTVDLAGNLCISGGGGTPGQPVPSQASYMGINVGGTLRGWTGVNPTGTVYAGQVDITSVSGSSLAGAVPTSSIATSSIVGAVAQARVMSLNTTNSTLVSATPGNLYAAKISNNNATGTNIRYLKVYDLNVAPTCGTSTPIATLQMPALGGSAPIFEGPISFVNGIGYCLTTGAADSDTGAVAANEITGVLLYKAQ